MNRIEAFFHRLIHGLSDRNIDRICLAIGCSSNFSQWCYERGIDWPGYEICNWIVLTPEEHAENRALALKKETGR